MQVQTGTAKGKKLKIPKTKNVRPTTSRIKKSMFDKLGNLDGLVVLDLFSGSGNLGIEALSKNAMHVTFVEKQKAVAGILRENIVSCEFEEKADIFVMDYKKAVNLFLKENKKFDLILIDPPYGMFTDKSILELIESACAMLRKSGTIVLEHNKPFKYNEQKFTLDTKNYGGTNITFFWSIAS